MSEKKIKAFLIEIEDGEQNMRLRLLPSKTVREVLGRFGLGDDEADLQDLEQAILDPDAQLGEVLSGDTTLKVVRKSGPAPSSRARELEDPGHPASAVAPAGAGGPAGGAGSGVTSSPGSGATGDGYAAIEMLLGRSLTVRERKILADKYQYFLVSAMLGRMTKAHAHELEEAMKHALRSQTIFMVRTRDQILLNGPLSSGANVVSALDLVTGKPLCVKLVTEEQCAKDFALARRISPTLTSAFLILPERELQLDETADPVQGISSSRRAAYVMEQGGFSVGRQGGKFDPQIVVRVAMGAAAAMLSCHTAGLLLVDFKPEHALLSDTARVCDIGSVTDIHDGLLPGGFTEAYALSPAPRADERHDLNTLAATMFELLSGEKPPLTSAALFEALDAQPGVVAALVRPALQAASVVDFVDRFVGPAAGFGMFYQSQPLQWMATCAHRWLRQQMERARMGALADFVFDRWFENAVRKQAAPAEEEEEEESPESVSAAPAEEEEEEESPESVSVADCKESDRPTLKLVSQDGIKFEVDRGHAAISGLLKATLSDPDAEELLMNVHSKVLREVVDYITHHQGGTGQLLARGKEMKEVCQDDWDAAFLDRIGKDRPLLCELVMAAHYMHIDGLLLPALAKLAFWMRSQPLQKIKEMWDGLSTASCAANN